MKSKNVVKRKAQQAFFSTYSSIWGPRKAQFFGVRNAKSVVNLDV